jgi:hypothetical protein
MPRARPLANVNIQRLRDELDALACEPVSAMTDVIARMTSSQFGQDRARELWNAVRKDVRFGPLASLIVAAVVVYGFRRLRQPRPENGRV